MRIDSPGLSNIRLESTRLQLLSEMPPASQRFSITVCTRASLDAPGCQAGQQKDEKMAASSMCLFLPAVVLWLNVYTMENVLYHRVWLIFVLSLNPSL